jgi:two-component system cell cycle sensor histidine kinase/response regulator CckA
VLLVEDQDVVRTLCERVLSNAGYRVISANSAEAAREHWRACSASVALLITDVVMPGEQGPALAAALLKERQDMAVLFMSGYAPETNVELGMALRDFIRKPFRGPEFLAKVRTLLDRAAQRHLDANDSRNSQRLPFPTELE